MTPRNFALWVLAGVLLVWLGAVAWQTRRCHMAGGQFAVVGWRCLMPKPSIILRRELERT
ncbi:MAG: hypothetical protein ABL908_19395 [Hyphomicrobium sp.]